MNNMSERYYTADEVGNHHRIDDAWVIVDSKVYDITSFLDSHPGGLEVLREHLGHDVSEVMRDELSHQHTGPAFELLDEYFIGRTDNERALNGRVMNGGSPNKKAWKEDDVVDWTQPLFSQVIKVGQYYDEWVHSPVNRKLRLFKWDIVEAASKSPWWLVPLVWVPTIIYICWLAMTGAPTYIPTLTAAPPLSPRELLVFLPLGVLLWTFLEYSLHRFVFHVKVPHTGFASKVLIPFHFVIHGQHHKVPFDSMRLVFPPVPAALIATAIFLPLAHILPLDLNQMRLLLAGALIGYVCYDMMHYYLHHGSPHPGGYLADLKSYHVAHHYVNPHLGYGISSKLWDLPFGTLLPASMFPGRTKKAN